ncbi:MAG TPA: hypothetical protein DF383_09650 [Deltaproteobacteria bacterium]|nr:hypothetical protein [Deltaproteobacteria bacterium]
MFRFILYAFLLYLLFRLLRRLTQRGGASSRSKTWSSQRVPPRHSTPRRPPQVIDEMKPCPACGTFNPTRLAFPQKNLYFCNRRCHEAYLKREQTL